MLVFADQVTERLKYTFDFVFERRGRKYKFTNDISSFLEYSGTKFNYSEYELEDINGLCPSGLLFSESFERLSGVEKSLWEGEECLKIGKVTDPFAAIFYVVSRYEEYVGGKRDKHDRFTASESCLFRFGWLEIQIVERWIKAIYQKYLPEDLPILKTSHRMAFVPSFDIDNTTAYRWKYGWRKWGAVAKDRVKGNDKRLIERREVLRKTKTDPYDTFDKILGTATLFPDTRVFWLLADYSEFDRNVSWRDPRHQRLIRTVANKAVVGLHPGYKSNVAVNNLGNEQRRLTSILGKVPEESRQHFLKVVFPTTYRNLKEAGFRRDFSMGFSDAPGFRMGTAHPVPFFDLLRNESTDYLLIPFVYMDGTFNDYMHTSIEGSKEIIAALWKEVQAFGGVFCFIWHNETIGDYGRWEGWSEVLEYTLQLGEHATDLVRFSEIC